MVSSGLEKEKKISRHRLQKAKVEYGNRTNAQEGSSYWKEGTRNRKRSLVMFKTVVQKNKSNCKSSATMFLDIQVAHFLTHLAGMGESG